MKKLLASLLVIMLFAGVSAPGRTEEADMMEMTWTDYQLHVRAAWLGKMVGVSVGRLIEFQNKDKLAAEEQVPTWDESLLTIALAEDDIYIPFAMLNVLAEKGVDVSGAEMAVSLYPYSFEFWNSHYATFEKGIAPPYAGHPDNAPLPDGLSYSFAADFTGLIAPGNGNIAVEMAQRFGSMLVYGDGIYGGAFIGAMNAEAFLMTSMEAVVHAGLSAVPEDSGIHKSVSQVLSDWQNGMTFEDCWEHVEQRFFRDAEENWIEWPYGGRTEGIDLDAKLNCAYIAMSLLYGQGDIAYTLQLALRCGQDTDSNAANAFCILFNTIGWDGIPETYKAPLKDDMCFTYVNASFSRLIELTEQAARQLNRSEEHDGMEWLQMTRQPVVLPTYTQNSKTPEPMAHCLFSDEQMSRMVKPAMQDGSFERDWHSDVYPPWIISADAGYSGIDLAKGFARTGRNNAWLCPAEGVPMSIVQRRISVSQSCDWTAAFAVCGSDETATILFAVTESDGEKKTIAKELCSCTSNYTRYSMTLSTNGCMIVDVMVTILTNQPGAWFRLDDFALAMNETHPDTEGQ